MYYRLKNSLIALAASVGLLFALGFAGAPVPAQPQAHAQHQITTDLLRLANQLPARDAEERSAWLIGAAIAGIAADAAIVQRHITLAKQSAARRRVSDRTLRMPFYSFASQGGRTQES